ncbi:MFS transporter [Haladaptatus sp. AB643]|uniref:MDR family MFS transporter n=1 Tax=unclassified Haladaptatus TaxID=2622732 RepID=UPI00209C5350|nr:MFS transporter [Haladaptatus sp. AB643]MCO8255216.1 MFS transporter [Haladaptatus sp. AB618]
MSGGHPTSSPVEEWPRRRLAIVLGGLMLAIMLSALDQTIVSTALPTIASDLGSVKNYSWIVTAYLITTTASAALYGKLSDIYGRRALFTVAVSVFVVGSALCAAAGSIPVVNQYIDGIVQLALLRALQGIGAGGLWVLVLSILGDMFGPRKRSEYISYMLSGFGAALVIGPLVGGWLTEHFSWHWIFLINLPLGVLSLALVWAYLDIPQETVDHPIDYFGALLLVAALTTLILATSWGGGDYAWDSPTILGLFGLTAVLAVAFVVQEVRTAEPVFPIDLVSNRGVGVAMGLSFVIGLGQLVGVTYLPLYLQAVTGVSATNSGLLLLPLLGGMIVVSAITGQLISRYGRLRVFPVVGFATASIGYYLFSTMTPDMGFTTIAGFMLVTGVGLGFVNPVLSLSAQLAVDRTRIGVATTSVSVTRSLGSGIGVAVLGSVFTSTLTDDLTNALGPKAAQYAGASQNVNEISSLPSGIQHAVINALSGSLTTMFLWTVPVIALGFLLAFALPNPDMDEGSPGTQGTEDGVPSEDGHRDVGTGSTDD